MMRAMKKSIGDNMIPKAWGFERGLELVKQAASTASSSGWATPPGSR